MSFPRRLKIARIFSEIGDVINYIFAFDKDALENGARTSKPLFLTTEVITYHLSLTLRTCARTTF